MIATSFLNEVATFVLNEVEKIVINDTYEITDFEKNEADNIVNLRYLIPASEISMVEKIEVIGKNNKIISSNEVSIPLTSDHIMLQSLEVREGE